jgi:hypothetical protein
MNILSHLQELDDLIIEHTKPPVTTILRHKLAFALEQAEAHSTAVERQEQTLSRQVETIDGLMKANQSKDAELAKLKEEIARRNDPKNPEILLEHYDYIDPPGLYKSKTHPERGFFCSRCLPNGTPAQMTKQEHGWQCNVCPNFKNNPNNPPPLFYPIRRDDRFFGL